MVILFFGPPGSGKGTQSHRIAEWLAARIISTGDLLRAEVEAGSELGVAIRQVLDDGGYVDDEIVNRLVERQLDLNGGAAVILDGYPRTLPQARFLELAMNRRRLAAPAVLRLEVPAEELVSRLGSRRQCPGCGSVYHLYQKPPRAPGVCDTCGHALLHRNDDKPEVIAQRLAAYDRLTAPVLAYFGRNSHRIDGTGSPREVFHRIRSALQQAFGDRVRSAPPE